MNGMMRTIGLRIAGDAAGFKQATDEAKQAYRSLATTVDDSGGKVAKSSKSSNETVRRESDKTKAKLKESEKGYRDMADTAAGSFSRVTGSIGRLVGVAGLGAIVTMVGRTGLSFLEFQQNATIAMSTMLGGADAAKTFLADVLSFAKETPFAFTDLTEQAQRLLAFGIESERVIPILRSLGDAAMGTGGGAEKLKGLSMTLGQIASKGRLQGEEILQLAERGIPALTILANKADMTAAAFSKEVTKGVIDADTAIRWLTEGLNDGTTGINGTTAAFGGLMEQVKGSGGITATFDSAKSAFRNTSAELVESLLPSIISLVNLGADALRIVTTLASGFNSLPTPVRNAALALAALLVVQRLMGRSMLDLSHGAVTSFTGRIARMRLEAQMAGTDLGRLGATTRLAGNGVKAGFAGVAAALNPVTLGIAAVTLGLSVYSERQAHATRRASEYEATVDSLTAALTESKGAIDANVRAAAVKELQDMKLGAGEKAVFEGARELGIGLDVLTDGYLGNADALAELVPFLQQIAGEYDDYHNLTGDERVAHLQRTGAAMQLLDVLQSGDNALADSRKRIREQSEAMNGSAKSADGLGSAYANASVKVRAFAEDQQKAIDKAREAAESAFMSAFAPSGMKLNVSTKDDETKALDAVSDATRGVRDAEARLAETRSGKERSANDITRAEEAVTEARKKAKEATDSLADVETRRDPVKQYKKTLKETEKAAVEFRNNILKLGERGLNGKTLQELIAQGPEGSKDTVDALLGDKKLIGSTNDVEKRLGELAGDLGRMASLAETDVQAGGGVMGKDFALGFKIMAESETATSVAGIAAKLGESPDEIRRVGRGLGLTFIEGFMDSLTLDERFGTFAARVMQSTGTLPAMPGTGGRGGGMALGGIYPGYTPGVDIGYIGISGGEAVMRPEWTRAVGPDWVHRMNALARSGGASAVRAAMQQMPYLGGYASGGIPVPHAAAPQVIRLTESQTVGYPMTVQNLTVQSNNVTDLERQIRDRRRRAFTGGRP